MAGKRPRDSYKARVLQAQTDSKSSRTLITSARPLIDKIIGWKWWENQPRWLWSTQGTYNIRFAYAQGCHFSNLEHWRINSAARTTIWLPFPQTLDGLEVVHALAHHLHPDDIQLHGPEFCSAFLKLTHKALDQDAYDDLYRNLQLRKAKLHVNNSNVPKAVNPMQTTEQLKKLLADLERDMQARN